MALFQNLRMILLLLAWLAALVQIIFGEAVTSLLNTAVVLYLIYLLITLPLIKRGSVIIIGFLGLISVLTIQEISQDVIFDAGRFVLIFAGLVPTMILAKSTASTMPSVVKTQERLAALPPEHSSAGLQIAGHAFGGVINTGTFGHGGITRDERIRCLVAILCCLCHWPKLYRTSGILVGDCCWRYHGFIVQWRDITHLHQRAEFQNLDGFIKLPSTCRHPIIGGFGIGIGGCADL